ncbi:MAG: hypothetical protein KDB90_09355 [Planctomycetes bacterium]|nr:hypothetical protein [Planctomycetota bacterium]
MKKFPLIATALAVACLFVAAPNPAAQDSTPTKDTTAQEAKAVDYLIICADGLKQVADDWAKYRADNGRVTKVMPMSSITHPEDMDLPGLTEIKNAILETAGGDEIREGFQVLLLGDCPNNSSTDYDAKTEIPWMLTRQMDSNPTVSRRERVPTDNFYADLVQDDDGLPDIAVGRIPARTVDEARLALAKVKAYEAAKQGEWLRNLTFFAGEGHFGAVIDGMLEKLFIQFAESLSQAHNVRMTYANINSPYAYVPTQFSDKVIEEANAGALLLCYLGHGAHDRLDDMYVEVDGKNKRYPILTSDDVSKFNIEGGKLPVMMIIACETGHLDHPQGCLAEKICFTEKAPVAVIASSRDSHPYSNTLLEKAMVHELTDNYAPTLGQAFMDAKRELVLATDPDRKRLDMMAMFIIPEKERIELNQSHQSLYNLTGDPGLRIQYPKLKLSMRLGAGGEPIKADSELSVIIDSTEDIGELDAEIWVECTRATLAHEVKEFDKAALTGADGKKREAAEKIVAQNHANSNDKHLAALKAKPDGKASTETTLEDGSKTKTWQYFFKGKLDSPLEPGDYILKVFARDSKGERCGFAAVKLNVSK